MMRMSEETDSEPIVKEKKSDCQVIPEHIKPILDCCRDYDEGKIDSAEYFAKTLQKTGEFMQIVKKMRETQNVEPAGET
jgi:hypothetical protein